MKVDVGKRPTGEFRSRRHYCLHKQIRSIVVFILFFFLLNPMLCRLTSMLPDETLRMETRLFTALNRALLLAIFVCLLAYFAAVHLDPALPSKAFGWMLQASPLPAPAAALVILLDRAGELFALFFVLLPVAMTMALMWKIKEVILASVFGSAP